MVADGVTVPAGADEDATRERLARTWFAATAAAVAAGVVIQLPVTATTGGSPFADPTARTFNIFAFFTIDSNLIIGAVCLLLAIRLDRTSPVFHVARLTGLVAIVITGIVFHVAIANLLELDGWAQAANQLQHTVVPVMSVAGWLMFGPRGHATRTYAGLALIFPVLWMIFTVSRGAAIHWYPYPFINVDDLGYVRVAVNSVWIAVLFFAIAGGAVALDKFLVRLDAAR